MGHSSKAYFDMCAEEEYATTSHSETEFNARPWQTQWKESAHYENTTLAQFIDESCGFVHEKQTEEQEAGFMRYIATSKLRRPKCRNGYGIAYEIGFDVHDENGVRSFRQLAVCFGKSATYDQVASFRKSTKNDLIYLRKHK
jgi:hypothetical protein